MRRFNVNYCVINNFIKIKIAVSQSNFLPWPGYFSLIKSVDTFYFYDVVQFTRRDWRAKNFIKGSNGKILVAIPVKKTIQNTNRFL